MSSVDGRVLAALLAEEEDEEEEETELLLALCAKRSRQTARWWVHPFLANRDKQGSFLTTIPELKQHPDRFLGYFRMNIEQYQTVLAHIRNTVSRTSTWYREPISAEERFALCIRFLATGESYHSLSYSFRISVTTISRVIPEVCEAIWQAMSQLYMSVPKTGEQWKSLASNFELRWNFPNCVGAIDGKHIVMMAPAKSGSLYYNYKSTYSVILLAVVDASCKFVMIDVGAYGMNNDAGVFKASAFGKALIGEKLNLPDDRPLPGAPQYGPMPYVFVGDEAFPLCRRILRPYGGRGRYETEKVFNYRLSRARRTVENAFGILANRWRVFHTKIAIRPSVCIKVVKAACVLHNFLQVTSTSEPTNIATGNGMETCEGMKDLCGRGYRQQAVGNEIRDTMSDYFIKEGQVPWQLDKVRSGLFTTD